MAVSGVIWLHFARRSSILAANKMLSLFHCQITRREQEDKERRKTDTHYIHSAARRLASWMTSRLAFEAVALREKNARHALETPVRREAGLLSFL